MRQLCKGNVAIVKGAILAGCRSFYGYPITPASEIAEAAALYHPAGRRNFLAGGERSRRHQHGVRRSCVRGPRHDRILRPRTQLDAGRHVVHCRRRTALRNRRCRSRRPRLGQHRAGAERLLRHGERRRPRQLSQHRAGARLGAGNGRPHCAWPSNSPTSTATRLSFWPMDLSAR